MFEFLSEMDVLSNASVYCVHLVQRNSNQYCHFAYQVSKIFCVDADQLDSKLEGVLSVLTITYVSFSMFQPNLQTNTPHCGTQDTPHPIGTEIIEDRQRLTNEQRTSEVPNSKAAVAQQTQKLSEEIIRLHEQINVLEQVI
jgi:hypothetical protein